MTDGQIAEVPQTLEGYFVLHEIYAVDWPRWRSLDSGRQAEISSQATQWLTSAAKVEKGDSALFSVLTQKGDLMFVHYRESPEALKSVEISFQQTSLFEFLKPSYSYLSVIEISLYELTAMARKKLADQGVGPGSTEFEEFFETEMEKQKQRVQSRLFRDVPAGRYICFYPMNKKRGEQVNWYTLTMEQRRDMMRGHGRIGHKYHEEVTQIIGGSIGLDDWEWGVSLHADDILVFKKLIHEMRFDPASALYAEFGPFYLGIRLQSEQLQQLMAGRLNL